MILIVHLRQKLNFQDGMAAIVLFVIALLLCT